jgi:integrase
LVGPRGGAPSSPGQRADSTAKPGSLPDPHPRHRTGPRPATRGAGITHPYGALPGGGAGLPHLRLHDLRHQFASFLVNDGRTLYEVQQILGHSSSKVTERYAHLSTKTLQEAANSAAARLNGRGRKTA